MTATACRLALLGCYLLLLAGMPADLAGYNAYLASLKTPGRSEV